MFVQVIQGTTTDPEGLRRQLDRWKDEVRPADGGGWLGTTGGVADDGTAFFMARFESEEAARANSGRPEQDAWWNETSKYLDGVTFRDSTEVEVMMGGGSDQAGFVQVMQGRAKDRARLAALEQEFMPKLEQLRPDVIGNIRSWQGDEFVDVIYFTSEAEARKGEAAMANDTSADMAEFESLVEGMSFIDLKDPWLRSP